MLANFHSRYFGPVPVSRTPENAAIESFLGLLKRERVNRVRYKTRDEARADPCKFIEVFNNRERRHGDLGNISPVELEKQSNQSVETAQ